MSAMIFTSEDAQQANMTLILEEEKGKQAVHDVIVAMLANRRSGTASCKTKGDVALSGKKPWRQKGTGRARAGYASSPVWVGGGVAHGPHPRDYSKKVSKKVRKLALRKAFSARVISGDVLLVPSFRVEQPKTKDFVTLVTSLNEKARKTLIVDQQFDSMTFLAARNVKNVLLMSAAEVNTHHLLAFDKILVTPQAIKILSARLSSLGPCVPGEESSLTAVS